MPGVTHDAAHDRPPGSALKQEPSGPHIQHDDVAVELTGEDEISGRQRRFTGNWC
jgi:hypothetical protein